MRARCICVIGLFMMFTLVFSAHPQEKVYWDVVEKIMEEAFENSHVMENSSWLCDVFGPRNAKSSSFRAAAQWAKKRLEEYGLSNATLDPFEFGTGWENEYTSVHMMSPRYMPIIAYPPMWSAGTKGKVRGPVVYINFDAITSEKDLDQYRGKLKNTIIFTRPKQEMIPHLSTLPETYTEDELDEMAEIHVGPKVSPKKRNRPHYEKKVSKRQIIDFIFAEGAAVIASPDGRESYGTVVVNEVDGKPWEKDAPPPPTELVIAAEHYNRIMRILEKGIPVEMEVEIKVAFHSDDQVDYSVIAEIPGTDLADEVVMLGGHLDANSAGTGAMDNAAAVVIAMEAVRILKKIGVKPRRTIRVAFWGVHELGTFGSRSYVRKHFGDPETQQYKPEHAKFSAYYNMDIGPGKIRGIYIKGNEGVRPIFTEWMKPLKSLGMTHIITESIGSEDDGFRAVGLPGFHFLQDRKELDDRLAHTNMDVYERLIPEGLMQSSVVMATFVYHTAMRDELLPRIAPIQR
ncbi:MAG: M20/M25/M40 family metallo-hydrolase [Candidatus Aminicenantes bacterium]|nr:M20/M25/M40 family metallo-hydrolase [Candidatus Aminicenantes bacterium]